MGLSCARIKGLIQFIQCQVPYPDYQHEASSSCMFCHVPSSFFVSLIACPVNKMSHLLKLAQDYQAKGVLDLCVKCLQDVQKSKENVVKILSLANRTVTTREDGRLDSVRGECNNLIKNMELSNVKEKSDFQHLDRDSLQSLYVERTGRLETFLKEVYPQFVGLAEYSLHLSLQSSHCGINRCPQHFPSPASSSKANMDLLDRLNSCPLCREMIAQLVSSSIKPYPLNTGLNAASMPPEPTAITIPSVPNSTSTKSQIGSGTMNSARTKRAFDTGTSSSVSTGSAFSFGTLQVQSAPEACSALGPKARMSPQLQSASVARLGPRPQVQSTPEAYLSPGPGFQLAPEAQPKVQSACLSRSGPTCPVDTGILDQFGVPEIGSKQHHYGGSYHFDQKLISIIKDFQNVIALPSGTN